MKFKIKKSYYRIFSLVLTIIIIALSVPTSAASNTESKVLLSSLSKEECVEFLADNGIAIPEVLEGMDVQKLIAIYEADLNFEYVVSYTVLADFLSSVRQVVNEYYGYNRNVATLSMRNTSEYTLQYSTLYSWDSATMPLYNCYAYSIGHTTHCNPGNFSNQGYNGDASVTDLAFLVKDDLNGDLNKACAKVLVACPSSISGWDGALAVRKQTTLLEWQSVKDYHVAKLSSSDWYHKPGGSAILKFNDPPSNAVDWTNEGYKGYYYGPSITYDSDVIFLLYKENHSATANTRLQENYHRNGYHYFIYAYICKDCNGVISTWPERVKCSGPPCILPSTSYNSYESS